MCYASQIQYYYYINIITMYIVTQFHIDIDIVNH